MEMKMSNNFNFTVDTAPMADSVDTVSYSVKGVTGAVVAMQSAVINAEREASKKICENVDSGFYILMSSQLSQKMALCSSQISSHLLRMQKFRSDILSVKNAMQNDYNRISSRYFKLFNSLDKNLEQRIKALDSAAVKIAKVDEEFLLKARDESASLILVSGDGQMASQKAIVAKVKTKTARAISVMAEKVKDNFQYKENVAHTLMEETVEEEKNKYAPLIVCESESMVNEDNFVKTIYTPEKSEVYNLVQAKNEVQNTQFNWNPSSEEEQMQIRSFFEKQCQKEGLDERIVSEMMRLFESSSLQEITEAKGGEQ